MQSDDRHILTRIIVLLLSLASLAESAARMPYPLRVVLLRILRWAEPYGRSVVTSEATRLQVAPWLMSSAEAHHGNTPAAAFSLAMCFRMLARALANLVRLGRRFSNRIFCRQRVSSNERLARGCVSLYVFEPKRVLHALRPFRPPGA